MPEQAPGVVAPWDLNRTRNSLLVYYGGIRGYGQRLDAIRSFDQYSQRYDAGQRYVTPLAEGITELFTTTNYAFRTMSDAELKAQDYHTIHIIDVFDYPKGSVRKTK